MEFTIEKTTLISFFSTFCVVLGHNLWLLACEKSEGKRLEIRNHDLFPESDAPVRPERIESAQLHSGQQVTDISGFYTVGNSTLADLSNLPSGNLLATLQTRTNFIALEPKKFVGYLKHEDSADLVKDLSEETEAQTETYTKYAKVFFRNGDVDFSNEIFGKEIGQRLEIIPLINPLNLKKGESLPVKVLFEGKPLAGVRVSSGGENINGGKYFAHTRTDDGGFAEIRLPASNLVFVRTHFIRRHPQKSEAKWESCWFSMTFRIN